MTTASVLPLPESLTAGDRWRIAVSPDGLTPADGATAAVLHLNGPVTLTSTAVSAYGAWVCTISETDTAALPEGTYRAALRVTTASLGPVTVPCTALAVLPNVATAAAGAYLTHEERCIPLLQRALERRVTVDLKAYTIQSRQATREELKDMLAMLNQYRLVVARRANGGRLPPYRFAMGRAS